MKKRTLSLLLIITLAFQVLFSGGVQALSVDAAGSDFTFAGDEFLSSLARLLRDNPLQEDGFSALIFDTEQNTMQKDSEDPVSLSTYDADFVNVDSLEPVFPIIPVLESMGVGAEIDSETGDILTYENGEEERFSLDDPEPAGSDADNAGLRPDAGFVTLDQAYDLFHCEAEYADGKIIVSRPFQTMRLVLETMDGQDLSNTYGAEFITDSNGYYVLQFDTEDAAKSAYEAYQKDAGIEYVVPDRIVTAAALSDRSGANTIQSDRFKQYLAANSKTSKVVVAVVDTGADVSHPFLKERLLPGYNFDKQNTNVNDGNGHGTHVSGIVVDNTPDTVKILPVKTLNDKGEGSNLTVKLAIDYAVQQKANVINLSLGGPCAGANCPIEQAIKNAVSQGVTVVAAAGNDSLDTKDFCPANISDSIVVAASDGGGTSVMPFSNYGSTVDITAPGGGILSSIPGGGYGSASGTSMAAPFVAAAAAMLLTENPALKPAQVESKLCSMATDMLIKGKDIHTGAGLVNFGLFFGDNVLAAYISSSTSSVDMLVFGFAVERMATVGVSADNIPSNRSFTVQNSNPKVAAFDGRYFKALSPGTTKITLTLAQGASCVFTVTVTKREVWLDYAAKSYAGGSGTKSSPYLIAAPQQLAKFALDVRNGNSFKGKYIKLTADIDLAGKEWITATDPDAGMWDAAFYGVFDGNNHVIKNMKVFNEPIAKAWGENTSKYESWYQDNTGLFGTVQSCEIKNLGLVNAYSSYEWGGLLASDVSQHSKISSCYTTGFSGGAGLFGYVHNYDIEIRDCFSSATVKTAGIANDFYASSFGSTQGATKIINSYFCGEVLGSSTWDGVGVFSYSLGNGSSWDDEGIYNCFAASVSLDGYGFVTRKDRGVISKSYYLADNPTGLRTDKTPALTSLKAKPLTFFQTKESFTTGSNWNSAYPWDFTNVWAINPKINNGLPYLKKLPPPPAASPVVTNSWLDYAAPKYAGGKGTQQSPFLIETPQQLARLAKSYRYGGGKDLYFKLTKNIDLAGHNWYPIGAGDELGKRSDVEEGMLPNNLRYPFYGHIDGNNKTISNLRIQSQGDMVGFVSLLQGGNIKNLTLKNAEVTGRNYVGAVAGYTYLQGKLYNCTVSGTVNAGRWAGSITGYNDVAGVITGANASVSVTANKNGGGITGYNHGSIEQSQFTGMLNCIQQPGGLVSDNYGIIRNCFSIGPAPLAGNLNTESFMGYYGDVYNSYSAGTNSYLFGDCFGYSKNIPETVSTEQLMQQSTFPGWDFVNIWQIDPSKNGGAPSLQLPAALPAPLPNTKWEDYAAKSYAGGNGTSEDPYLIATGAQLARVIVSERTNNKAFSGKYYRLIRNIDLGAHLWCSIECAGYYPETMYFDGNNKTVSNMTMSNGCGLFEFGLEKGYIKNLHLKNVKGQTQAGIINVNNASITGCSVSGDIFTTSYSDNAIGAICSNNYGTIQKCFSSASVLGYHNVGGIAGYNTGTVSNCYTTGAVFGFNSASSIVSNNAGGTVKYCYATGRLTGMYRQFGAESNSYYDQETTGLSYDEGQTTAQMKNQSTYKNWDFQNTWAISPDVNGGYPTLRAPVPYKINYVLNGGKNSAYAEFDYMPGSFCTLQTPTKDGYYFTGWFTNAKLSGTAVTKILKTDTGDKTYYAKWAKCPDVTAITGNPADLTMGKSVTLKATLSGSGAPVIWTSSDAKIATADKTTGIVKGTGAGVVKITASAGGNTKTVTITVHRYVSMRIGKTQAVLNGKLTTIDSAGTKPFKIKGTTMLPLRFVGEKMGGKVSYVNDSSPIVMSYGSTKVEFMLNQKTMKVIQGEKTSTVILPTAAQKVKGKTYIPLRAISQALGFSVYYESGTEYIVVNNPNMATSIRNVRLKEAKSLIKK